MDMKNMDMNKVVAKIEWTVQDLHDNFVRTFKREPSKHELEAVVNNFSAKGIENAGIESGWDSINDYMNNEVRNSLILRPLDYNNKIDCLNFAAFLNTNLPGCNFTVEEARFILEKDANIDDKSDQLALLEGKLYCHYIDQDVVNNPQREYLDEFNMEIGNGKNVVIDILSRTNDLAFDKEKEKHTSFEKYMINKIEDILKNDFSRINAYEKIKTDFQITINDIVEKENEIIEANPDISPVEAAEELAYRLIAESVDMHGFESQLGGRLLGNSQIETSLNEQIMDARSIILERTANAYISGELKFNAIQEYIDEHLKVNFLYKELENKRILTDFLHDNKELQNGSTARIYSFSPFGYEGSLVSLETDIRRGIPAYDIVGISDGAVKETRERIRAAISNSGLSLPPERVLQSFSPADLRKDGGMELAAALDMMNVFQTNSTYQNKPKNFINENVLVLGSLNLAGQVEPVRGALAAVKTAAAAGINHVICNNTNFMEISSVPGIKVCVCGTLNDAIHAIENHDNFKEISVEQKVSEEVSFPSDIEKPSFNLEGYYKTAHSIEIAVAGKHNLLLVGAPGCGKTTTIQQLVPYLTPCLTDNELQSVNRIKSLAGLTSPNNVNSKNAPFRMPHQTASIEGICGGGPNCRPGEISLAHNGILFLDEAAEFRSSVLQILRVPQENGAITLSRAGRTTVYPAKHQLIMAANPCPCGNYGCSGKVCLDSIKSIDNYWKKFSEPLLDRIAVREYVEKNTNDTRVFNVEKARENIKKAFEIQRKRGTYNNDLTEAQLGSMVVLDENGKNFYKKIVESEDLSHREVINMLRLSVTIANMEGRENVLTKDLKEAFYMVLPVFEKKRSVNINKRKNIEKDFEREGR